MEVVFFDQMFFLFVAILSSILEEEGHPSLQCLRFCSDPAAGALQRAGAGSGDRRGVGVGGCGHCP